MKKQKITKRDMAPYNSIPKWIAENRQYLYDLDKQCSRPLWVQIAIDFLPVIVIMFACGALLYNIQ